MTSIRSENSLGSRKIPDTKYYGVQTLRAKENFKMTGISMKKRPKLIRALGAIKSAVAKANFELGLIDEKRANAMLKAIGPGIAERAEISVIDGGSQVGSGAVPVETIPTKLIQIIPKAISAETLGQELRRNNPPIFTRVQKGAVWIDLRTVSEDEETIVRDALLRTLSG